MPAHPIKIDLRTVEDAVASGMTTQPLLAGYLGVSKATIQRRMGTATNSEADEEFCQAIERGKARLANRVISQLLTQGEQGSTPALIAILDRVLGMAKNTKSEVDATHSVAPSFRIVMQTAGTGNEIDAADFERFKQWQAGQPKLIDVN